MSDLGNLSDADLIALYRQSAGTPSVGAPVGASDLSKLSDADLQSLYGNHPSALADAGKSIASGLENATIGTLGSVGDLRSLASKAVDAAGAKFGFDPSKVKNVAASIPGASLISAAPTSQQIRATVTDPVVSPEYQPQSGLGDVLKTGAEFLPAMADPELSGPGLLRSGAKLFASRVAAPALASTAAGALTKGTEAEPYARVIGALAGGAGAAKLANTVSDARAVTAATPALADVKSAASNAYDALTSRNVATPIPQAALDNLANDIRTTLNQKGIRPSTAQSIHDAVDEIATPATAGAPDVADLVAARQNIKNLLSSPDANKAGALVALSKIEPAIEQASPGAMAQLREADKNYAAAKANEALDKRTAAADLRASATNSGMNVGNKIRQNVASYLLSNEAKYLSPETKADLEKLVRGTVTQNAMRHIANLLGGGGGLGMLIGAGAGYETGGLPGAMAGAIAGHTLKHFGNQSVVNQADRAAQNIRLRSPLGLSNPPIFAPQISVARSALLPAFLARPKQQ